MSPQDSVLIWLSVLLIGALLVLWAAVREEYDWKRYLEQLEARSWARNFRGRQR